VCRPLPLTKAVVHSGIDKREASAGTKLIPTVESLCGATTVWHADSEAVAAPYSLLRNLSPVELELLQVCVPTHPGEPRLNRSPS